MTWWTPSVLHDIGKIAIPDVVLLKKSGLSPEDFEQMKHHCQIGAEALEEEIARKGPDPFLKMAMEIARSHHECFNGTGYPDGLEGEAIPLPARIVALIDTFDGLTSPRVYKKEARFRGGGERRSSPKNAVIVSTRSSSTRSSVVVTRFAEIHAETFAEPESRPRNLTVQG